MVSANAGLLVTLAAAPAVFNRIGVAEAVVLCGVLYAGVGVVGLWRFRRKEGDGLRPSTPQGDSSP
jgi:hypothetical protein